MRSTLRRAALGAATILLTCVLASGCGSGDNAGDKSADTGTNPDRTAASATGTTLDISIQGDTLTPNGDRLDVKVGETVTINVTSDRSGELHVHATPEQVLEYDEGSTTLELTIDKPGIVDVEDHVADVVVAQLQVS